MGNKVYKYITRLKGSSKAVAYELLFFIAHIR